jgi:hypothetical protein
LLLLVLVPLAPLWRAVFLGQAIGPFDQIRQLAPWNGSAASQPWDVLQADSVLQFYPWRDMVFESWRNGQIPAWNPYELAGTPLLANSQSGGFYPPHILLGLLHFPTAIGITLLAWFHLAWAGIGIYFLTRRLGGNRVGSFIAGASFGLSSFMVAWTALASVISTVAWIPWTLACIVALFRESLLEGSKPLGPKRLTVLALTGSVAMMLLAGHLQFAAYGLMAAVIVALGMSLVAPKRDITRISLRMGRDGEPIGAPKTSTHNSRLVALAFCILGLGLGGLLAAPQILPVLSYGKFSHRQNVPTAEGYAGYAASAIKPFELANLAIPNALGSPRSFVDPGDNEASQYWPAFVKQGDNFAESAVGVGPLILIGLFVVPWKRRELWPVAVLGLVGLLLSLGTTLNMALYFLMPGWSATGSPGRAICLFLIGACTLGGLGIGEIATGLSRNALIRAIAALGVGIALAYAGPLLAPSGGVPAATLASIQAIATAAMLPTLLISIVLAAVAVLLITNASLARYRPLAVVVIPVALCWVGYGSNLLMTGKPLDPLVGVPEHSRVAFINSGWNLLSATRSVAPPNTASLSRIHELGGYDSLIHRDTDALLHDVDGEDPAPPANGNMMFIKPKADPAKLAQAGVTLIWTPNDSDPNPLRGPGRCSVPGGDCQITSEDYRNIDMNATGGGQLTLRDRMMPGWSAEVDGKPVTIGDGPWRTVDLGVAGSHRVHMSYTPPGLSAGLILFALGGLALLAFFVVPILGRKLKTTL